MTVATTRQRFSFDRANRLLEFEWRGSSLPKGPDELAYNLDLMGQVIDKYLPELILIDLTILDLEPETLAKLSSQKIAQLMRKEQAVNVSRHAVIVGDHPGAAACELAKQFETQKRGVATKYFALPHEAKSWLLRD